MSSCNDGANPSQIGAVVEVTKDAVLCRDYTNVKFIISKSNVSLDLGGHTLTNNTNDVTVQVRPELKNVKVVNGTIKGKWTAGGVHFQSTYNMLNIPNIVNNQAVTENRLWAENAHGLSKVENIKFEGIKTSVYIEHYVSGINIRGNQFTDNERMAIYLDASSRQNQIENNHFLDNGFRLHEGFKRRRGHISVDGSTNNVISHNTFKDTRKKQAYLFSFNNYAVPAIEFYRNCGEASPTGNIFPRLHGADYNTLDSNTFDGTALAVWFKYRDHDQLSSCGNPVKYSDKADYNTITNSTLVNVDRYVIDEGIGNSY